jgi:hypothetical protein
MVSAELKASLGSQPEMYFSVPMSPPNVFRLNEIESHGLVSYALTGVWEIPEINNASVNIETRGLLRICNGIATMYL